MPRKRGASVMHLPVREEVHGVWNDGHRNDGSELSLKHLRVAVHHHIGYPPDHWLVSCYDLGIRCRDLMSKDLERAKLEALDVVETHIRQMHKEVQGVIQKAAEVASGKKGAAKRHKKDAASL